MFHTTHTIVSKYGKAYTYPAYKSAKRINGKHRTFMRTYGVKRTAEEAKLLVKQWENSH